jgi:hypothetical protein
LVWAVLLALSSGCAATTVETRFREPGASSRDLSFDHVIAIAQMKDDTIHRKAEDQMVRVLLARPAARARGMRAVPSYTLFSQGDLEDVARLRAQVEAEGYEGAVLMRLVSDQDRVRHVPGRYEMNWSRVATYDRRHTAIDRVVRLETSVYSVAQGKRLWSGVTRTVNPSDLPELMDGVADAVGAELTAQGLRP